MTVTIAENTHRLLAIIIYSTAIFKYIEVNRFSLSIMFCIFNIISEIIIALTYMDTYV